MGVVLAYFSESTGIIVNAIEYNWTMNVVDCICGINEILL